MHPWSHALSVSDKRHLRHHPAADWPPKASHQTLPDRYAHRRKALLFPPKSLQCHNRPDIFYTDQSRQTHPPPHLHAAETHEWSPRPPESQVPRRHPWDCLNPPSLWRSQTVIRPRPPPRGKNSSDEVPDSLKLRCLNVFLLHIPSTRQDLPRYSCSAHGLTLPYQNLLPTCCTPADFRLQQWSIPPGLPGCQTFYTAKIAAWSAPASQKRSWSRQ